MTEKTQKAEADEPRLHPDLTNEEFKAAQAKARAKIIADRKKVAAKMVEEQEIRRLADEENMRPDDDTGGDLVTIQIDIAPYAPNITLDGRQYWPGQIVTCKRRVADSLREIMFNTWRHEHTLKDEPLTQFYQRQRLTKVSMKSGAVSNAPTGA